MKILDFCEESLLEIGKGFLVLTYSDCIESMPEPFGVVLASS